jgi:glycine/sarcosine N-methyltransferase
MAAHPHSARTFYDELAEDYHYLYEDWDAAVDRQGKALDALLRRELGHGSQRVWDCACGIGTQAVGLAAQGHDVVGTDLSPNAVARSATEAAARSLPLRLAAADMRRLPLAPGRFDAVLCADNSLAHLLTSDDVTAALGAMRQALREEGLLVIGLRPYDELRAERRTATQPQVTRTQAGRVISFQLWDWHPDGEHYDLEHIQLRPAPENNNGDTWQVRTRNATSWAITRTQLTDLVSRAGFTDVTWHAPEETAHFQPLLTGRKRSEAP